MILLRLLDVAVFFLIVGGVIYFIKKLDKKENK